MKKIIGSCKAFCFMVRALKGALTEGRNKKRNSFIRRTILGFFRLSTLRELRFDLMRQGARWRTRKMLKSYERKGSIPNKLHFGCGEDKINGWLNIDIAGSDIDIDLTRGKLPFNDEKFDFVLSQHVIEHLELKTELEPLLNELHRTMKTGGEIWSSCPSIEKICQAYINDKAQSLVLGRQKRFPYSTLGYPSSFIVNDLFHQGGQHKNLFDFDLLEFVLKKCGFSDIQKVEEEDLLNRFEGFLSRGDGEQTLYVKAIK